MARFILVLALLVPGLSAQETRTSNPPVTREEVWQAVAGELRARGLRELPSAEELDLPVAVPAAAGRTLQVVAVCWDRGLGRAEFRLQCREGGQCVPFLAYARMDRNSIAGSCRSRSGSASAQNRRIAVRAGQRAIVVVVANRLRLTASVICLERGSEGEIIRVRNQDGHVFHARIVTQGVLEALAQ